MKRAVLLMVLAVASMELQAQYNQANRNNGKQSLTLDRFYFGGGGGFGAGTDVNGYSYNYFSLFPIIGYRLTDQVSVGATITYQQYNYPQFGTSYKQYGFGPFLRYSFNPVFFQVEYDLINAPSYNSSGNEVHSNYSRFFLGMGYALPLGKKGAVNALAMYDILYKAPSVFNSPFVLRIYFTI